MGTRIAIRGWGAVSPAGWGAAPLAHAISRALHLPAAELPREGKKHPALGRRAPAPVPPPPFLRHPRLRRTSPVGRFAVAAALEALGDRRDAVESGTLRTGIVFCGMNGIVEYSRRFYRQALENPAHASPILFPETVYNAPASHLGAILGSPDINYTLLGDSSQFVAGLDLAAQWLSSGRTDACLVVASEELDWLSAEAFQIFEPGIPVAEGAAALFVERRDLIGAGEIELHQIAGPTLYSPLYSPGRSFPEIRTSAGMALRRTLVPPSDLPEPVLIDGTLGGAGTDPAEEAVWDAWERQRFAPLRTTGPAFSVSAGWQCVFAAHLLANGLGGSAVISALGGNQQASAAIFCRV